ncbi:hypothetical protein SUGI_0111040 [Cryptomeria japonica]|nr:hypothetical protein SUGI_0111040 [Cryptomeria japonica]
MEASPNKRTQNQTKNNNSVIDEIKLFRLHFYFEPVKIQAIDVYEISALPCVEVILHQISFSASDASYFNVLACKLSGCFRRIYFKMDEPRCQTVAVLEPDSVTAGASADSGTPLTGSS